MTERHNTNQLIHTKYEEERRFITKFTKCTLQKEIGILELNLCFFIADHNPPLSLIDPLTDFLRICFPENKALKEMRMRKQKTSDVIRYGI